MSPKDIPINSKIKFGTNTKDIMIMPMNIEFTLHEMK